MTDKKANEKEIKRLKKEYERYSDRIYDLKMKKLQILTKYRKKLDDLELSKLKESTNSV